MQKYTFYIAGELTPFDSVPFGTRYLALEALRLHRLRNDRSYPFKARAKAGRQILKLEAKLPRDLPGFSDFELDTFWSHYVR